MSALLSKNSLAILEARYLEGETVNDMWDRVSGGNDRFRELLSSLRFLPNSPTLFNMGRNNGCTSSACFVFDVQDSMFGKGSIVETRNKATAVAKAGGGVGYYGGNIRPKGSLIKSVHRKACGPVAVLRDYHGIRQLVTQGGKRDLAQMFILPAWHEDCFDFVHCKDEDPKSLESFNISVSWTDQLVAESLVPGSRYEKLWMEQVHSAWSHGCPGMFFYDAVNRANPNPHLGWINAPNPCGETPNRTDEPCNLGSLALPRYFTAHNRGINWNLLEQDIRTAIQLLDDILDRNEFPHPDITQASFLTRKLGLGVMGWADLLAMMHIHYDTEEALNLADKLMRFISEVSLDESVQLAKQKGPYGGYSDRSNGPYCRNETRTSIAPTGTIALIAGVWGSIEPHFAFKCNRVTNEGIKMEDGVPDWIAEKLDGFIPKIASEIDWRWHVRMQAAFQKHTCLGVSKTINLPKTATEQDISDSYRLMHELKCKGGTVYRDGCRSEQVLRKKSTKSVYLPDAEDSIIPKPKLLGNERKGTIHKFRVGGIKCYLTAGVFDDGSIAEIFLRASKVGSTVSLLLDSWAIAFSYALQAGASVDALTSVYVGMRSEPCGITDNPDIPLASSIQDYVVRWIRRKFLSEIIDSPTDSGQFCPDCGSSALLVNNCLQCSRPGCGWTKCG